MTFEIKMVLPSVANLREFWAHRAKRTKAQRASVLLAMPIHKLARERGWLALGKLAIVMTRVAPRELDDDNLAGAMKACQDQIAAQLGVDDRDKRLTWVRRQEKPKKPGADPYLRVEFYLHEAIPF